MHVAVRTLPVLLAVLMTTGCSSLRLYVEARDKQGQEAKKAWEQVDVDKTVKTERENLNKLLVAELDTVAQTQGAIRDHSLRYMVSQTVDQGLASPVRELHRVLTGKDDPASTAKAYIERAQPPRDLASLQEDFNTFRLGQALCIYALPNEPSSQLAGALNSSDALLRAQAQADYKRLNVVCARAPAPPEEFLKPAGILRQYIDERGTARDALSELKQSASVAIKSYTEARDAYVAATRSSEANKADRVRAKAQELQKLAQALDQLNNAFADSFISQERLDSLEAFAKVVSEAPADGSKIPEDASKAAVAFVLIPRLLDDAQAAAQKERQMRALPLLLRSNYEQLRLDAVKRDIAAQEQIVQLHDQLVDVTLFEALQLSKAYRELGLDKGTVGLTALLATPISDAVAKGTPVQRQRLYTAAGWYLDAVNRLETQRFSIRYKLDAARFERALAYAEINAKQWNSLIGASVSQVADSAASGIKAETIMSIINTLGILWIGNGVNK